MYGKNAFLLNSNKTHSRKIKIEFHLKCFEYFQNYLDLKPRIISNICKEKWRNISHSVNLPLF